MRSDRRADKYAQTNSKFSQFSQSGKKLYSVEIFKGVVHCSVLVPMNTHWWFKKKIDQYDYPQRIFTRQFALETTQWLRPWHSSCCQSYVYCGTIRRFIPSRENALEDEFTSLRVKMSFRIISITVCTGNLWYFQCKNLSGIRIILHCLQHSLHLSLPIVTMLHYIMFSCL